MKELPERIHLKGKIITRTRIHRVSEVQTIRVKNEDGTPRGYDTNERHTEKHIHTQGVAIMVAIEKPMTWPQREVSLAWDNGDLDGIYHDNPVGKSIHLYARYNKELDIYSYSIIGDNIAADM